MKGNNEERGKEMLRDSGLNFATADDMMDAAAKVVAARARRGSPRVERRSSAKEAQVSVLVGRNTR